MGNCFGSDRRVIVLVNTLSGAPTREIRASLRYVHEDDIPAETLELSLPVTEVMFVTMYRAFDREFRSNVPGTWICDKVQAENLFREILYDI